MKQAIVILVLLAVGSVLAYYHVANQSYYPVSKLASADGYTFHMVQDRLAQRNACGEANDRFLAPIKARCLQCDVVYARCERELHGLELALLMGDPVPDIVAEHLDRPFGESCRAHRARDLQGARDRRGHPPRGHEIVEIGDMVAVQVGKKDLVKLRSDEAGGGQAHRHAAPAIEQQIRVAGLHQVRGPGPVRRGQRRPRAERGEFHRSGTYRQALDG